MPTKLTNVEIHANPRIIYKFLLSTGDVLERVGLNIGLEWSNLTGKNPILPSEPDATFIGATKHIGFGDLLIPRILLDGEYATQINGYHWVKLSGYEMIKIAPEYISSSRLSNEGVALIQTESVAQ